MSEHETPGGESIVPVFFVPQERPIPKEVIKTEDQEEYECAGENE